MRIFLTIILSIFMTSCSSKSYPPQAHFDIHASTENQVKVIEAMKNFGARNDFEVFAKNDLPRQGRMISQVLLKRDDGIMIAADNFLKEDILATAFYAKKPGVDWVSLKEAWLKAMTEALDGRGEIIEVPLDTPP